MRRSDDRILTTHVGSLVRPADLLEVAAKVREQPQEQHRYSDALQQATVEVVARQKDAGLDIVEHGMYGYPEQFIPVPELIGYATAPHGSRDIATPARPIQRSADQVPAT